MSERSSKAQTVLKDHISTVNSALQLILTTNEELANLLRNPTASPLTSPCGKKQKDKKTAIVTSTVTEGRPASPGVQHFPDVSKPQFPDDEEEFQGWNVLLCDDSPLNLRLLKHRFEKDVSLPLLYPVIMLSHDACDSPPAFCVPFCACLLICTSAAGGTCHETFPLTKAVLLGLEKRKH